LGCDLDFLQRLSLKFKANVFTYEYSGYGIAPGEASEQSMIQNLQIAIEFLKDTKDILPQHIILFGRSLGTGPTCDIAQQDKFAAIILQSPFRSILQAGGFIGAIGEKLLTIKDMFKNEDKIQNFKSPLLLIHGYEDEIIASNHSEYLKKVALQNKVKVNLIIIEGGQHNNLFSDYQPYVFSAIDKFFEEYNIFGGIVSPTAVSSHSPFQVAT